MIQILLSPDATVFDEHFIVSAGQTIVGKVIYDSSKIEDATATIALIGLCETHMAQGKVKYHSKVQLLRETIILQKGAVGENEAWLFQFTFPDKIEATTVWKQSAPFTVSEHDPPPSMSTDHHGWWDMKGKVSYKLKVKVSSGKRLSRDQKMTMPVYYIPRRSQNPNPKMYSITPKMLACSSVLLHPSRTEKRTLKEKMFSKQPVLTSIFNIILKVPEVAYIGGPLPIMMSLEYDEKSTAPLPDVILAGCTVTLIRNLAVRAKGFSEHDYNFTTKKVLKSAATNFKISRDIDLSTAIELPMLESKEGLTFSTQMLSQIFQLEIRLRVKCADKTFEPEMKGGPLTILSPLAEGIVDLGWLKDKDLQALAGITAAAEGLAMGLEVLQTVLEIVGS